MRILAVVFALALASLSCGGNAPRKLNLYPSPTVIPTQTERVVQITTTPISTYTEVVKIVTETPKPRYLCVVADEAVYLRPSPSIENYPVAPLPNGTRLMDLGGRSNGFAFVGFEEQQGWVSLNFVEDCN